MHGQKNSGGPRHNLIDKTGARNTAALIKIAVNYGLIEG